MGTNVSPDKRSGIYTGFSSQSPEREAGMGDNTVVVPVKAFSKAAYCPPCDSLCED